MLSEDFPGLADFRAGSLLAGYRLEAQAGTGGMFRARDQRLDRLVALKILGPALTADAGFRRRFIAGSRAAAGNPHIIRVREAGEAGACRTLASPPLQAAVSSVRRLPRHDDHPRAVTELAPRLAGRPASGMRCAPAH